MKHRTGEGRSPLGGTEAPDAVATSLGAAGIGVAYWDLADDIDWDATTCRMFGVEPRDAPDTFIDFLALLDEPSQERLIDASELLRSRGQPLDVVVRIENRVPSKATVRLCAAPSPRGESEARLCLLCLPGKAAPPTNRPEASFHESWRELAERSSDLFVEVDFDMRFTMVNPAMERLLGYRCRELQGRAILDFIHPGDIEKTKITASAIIAESRGFAISGTDSNFENRYRHRDGSYRWLSWSWMVDTGRRHVYGLARDITERKKLEAAQKEAMERLSQSNRDLQNFASVASHDLREPLRMITGYLKLLEDSYPDALDEKGRKFIKYACDGADRMRNLIEDLLSYSKLEHNGIKPVRTTLNEAILNAQLNLKDAIERRRASVEIVFHTEAHVEGDRIRLVRLFQNLLSNAMKFQREGNRPEIRVRIESAAAPDGTDGWRVSIRDNGIGIDPDHRDLLFQLFQRLNPRDTYEGSGIGLAVCKRVVEMHGGRIWFDSEVGKGSTFYVWLEKAAPS